MVTGRHAADLLSGILPTREHARLVLRAGLAGPAERTSAALFYDQARVIELACRRRVSRREIEERCPQGVYVARLPRDAPVDVTAGWEDRIRVVGRCPDMPTMSAALLSVQVAAVGVMPWVATLCGVIVLAADAHGLKEAPSGGVVFDLRRPAAWAATLEARLLATRRGRPWAILEPGRAGLSRKSG